MCEVKRVLVECGRNNVQVVYLHMNTLPGGLLDALTPVIDFPTKFTVIATGSVTATAPSFTVCEGLISIAARAGQVLVLVGRDYCKCWITLRC